MTPPSDEFILLGKITGAHGLRGEVKVATFTESPDNLTSYGPLLGKDGKTQYLLDIRGSTNDRLIAQIEGITNRNAAEKLKGTELFIPRDQLPDTREDEFYYHDLIGMELIFEDGSHYGTVHNVANYGASDLIEITMPDGKREILPFTDIVFPKVDVKNKKITINPPSIVVAKKESE